MQSSWVIASLSVGLGFVDEFRSERAVELLHSQLRRRPTVIRDGSPQTIDVVELVPGDVVQLRIGDLVPADMQVVEANDLECDEAVLTGESMPAAKEVGTGDEQHTNAYMGTVVLDGSGLGVVSRTGTQTRSVGSRSGSENGTPKPRSKPACATSRCSSCELPRS
jgi:Mg2+-importing ATPase